MSEITPFPTVKRTPVRDFLAVLSPREASLFVVAVSLGAIVMLGSIAGLILLAVTP